MNPQYQRHPYAKKTVVGNNAQTMTRATLTTFGKPIFLTRPEQNR